MMWTSIYFADNILFLCFCCYSHILIFFFWLPLHAEISYLPDFSAFDMACNGSFQLLQQAVKFESLCLIQTGKHGVIMVWLSYHSNVMIP